jgi:hypothetical protein
MIHVGNVRKEKMKGVNIAECFEKFGDTYSPKIVGDLNGQYVLLVRLEGDRGGDM